MPFLSSLVEPNWQNDVGETALMVAVKAHHRKAAKVLAKFASINDQSRDKRYLIALCYRYNMPAISARLFDSVSHLSNTHLREQYDEPIKAYFYQVIQHGNLTLATSLLDRLPYLLKTRYDDQTIAEVAANALHFELYYMFKKRAEKAKEAQKHHCTRRTHPLERRNDRLRVQFRQPYAGLTRLLGLLSSYRTGPHQ